MIKCVGRSGIYPFCWVKGKDYIMLTKLKLKNIIKKVGESGGKWGKNCTFAKCNPVI